MIQLPQITLYNIIQGALTLIKADYISKGTESILYQVFDGASHVKKDFLQEAIALFTRTPEDVRDVRVRMFYDAEKASIPTIHITLNQDMVGQNSIGVDEGSAVKSYADGSTAPIYMKRFDTNYLIICTSDNHAEVMMMYDLLRAVLISIFDSISILGLENPKISGQDIRLNENITPPHIFARAISVSCEYEIKVPRWWSNQEIFEIVSCNSKMLDEVQKGALTFIFENDPTSIEVGNTVKILGVRNTDGDYVLGTYSANSPIILTEGDNIYQKVVGSSAAGDYIVTFTEESTKQEITYSVNFV